MQAAAGVKIEAFFDPDSATFSYVVIDSASSEAAVIDPVLNYDAAAGQVNTHAAEQILQFLQQQQAKLSWILETHAHADHLSAAYYLKQQTGAVIAIGAGIRQVQHTFKAVFNLSQALLAPATDGFDKLLADNESFYLGQTLVTVINTPGHTNDSVSYLIAGNLFVGDSLFMPDAGTARCDFPGGDAHILFQSVQRIYQLPDETVMYICHDYQPDGRELKYQTTVGEQKHHNIHVREGTAEVDFVKKRQDRDKILAVPRLIYPAVQVNIRAGQLPDVEDNGQRYLKIPLS